MIDVSIVEKQYEVTYVGFYDLPKGRDQPMYVFYQENPKTELGHSNYMGLFHDYLRDSWYVTNAASITEAVFPAIKFGEGDYLVSRFRHNYVTRGSAMLDGGHDYCRYNPAYPPTHQMRVIDGKEVFFDIRGSSSGAKSEENGASVRMEAPAS